MGEGAPSRTVNRWLSPTGKAGNGPSSGGWGEGARSRGVNPRPSPADKAGNAGNGSPLGGWGQGGVMGGQRLAVLGRQRRQQQAHP
ncbi:hypothetical protein EV382_0315 [Micromonospora violae]|uniref:Uncharacterized protein n=1 Tax=Micromonospora violae TaxID=1278207 RepID=A0A4Q7U8G1_9ACTN|nr:hypothetical protein EV382_0315 [Micromonospora violae]